RPRDGQDPHGVPTQLPRAPALRAVPDRAADPGVADRRPGQGQGAQPHAGQTQAATLANEEEEARLTMPVHSFILNGERVSVDVEDDVRLLWVLRDVLGVTGPKYGCGIGVCQACTSHINGKKFNPCSVRISDIKPTDEITTIEGLAATVGKDLHPM